MGVWLVSWYIMASGLEWAVHKFVLHGEPHLLPHPLCTWAVEHRAHHREVAAGSLLLNHQGTAKGVFFGWSATIGFIIAIAPVSMLSALLCGVAVWQAMLLHFAGAVLD